MTFSYTVEGENPWPGYSGASGAVVELAGTFTDCQSGGSTMALGIDHGVKSIIHFHATNLTDADEEVQVAVSGATVTITTVTNDDDGTWHAICQRRGYG